ncbi:hypothetical protein CesoFtcFv8_022577 [Champsocephalus esox]|uniref:Uncharacterized protein n=1 Tax=Champsocephalus esox TaxID=159716 RepID=A0AAN8B7Q0_9TELE|nr:hypothetical protein CesoFtcFv8_022577 [Champsocephalus esox]
MGSDGAERAGLGQRLSYGWMGSRSLEDSWRKGGMGGWGRGGRLERGILERLGGWLGYMKGTGGSDEGRELLGGWG